MHLAHTMSIRRIVPNIPSERIEESRKFYTEFPALVLANQFVIRQFESPDNNLEAVFNYLTT